MFKEYGEGKEKEKKNPHPHFDRDIKT